MVSGWMDYGSINEFIRNYQGANRVQLVSNFARYRRPTGLIQLVGGCCNWVGVRAVSTYCTELGGGTILSATGCSSTDSGDQANIFVNQSPCACLADFGSSGLNHRRDRAPGCGQSLLDLRGFQNISHVVHRRWDSSVDESGIVRYKAI